MNVLRTLVAAALCFASLLAVGAAEPDPLARLDEALKAAAAFEHGADAAPLAAVEEIAVASVKDPKRREAVESRLLRLVDGPSTRDAREFACRQLFIVGTARAVPKLEPLLADPELSHMARYVLGRLEGPEAGAALVRALGKTSGKIQAGILGTLASRRCREALPEIARLLRSADAGVARAAAEALGDLGGAEAVAALDAARPAASEDLRLRIDDALMACADRALAENRKAEAAELYTRLAAADRPKQVRVGALRGLVQARGSAAAELLVAAIQGDDPGARASAIGFAQSVAGPEMTKVLVGLLAAAPAETQQLLLRALGERGDRTAAPAIVALAKGASADVRLAALDALGGAGDPAAVAVLVQAAAAAGGNEQAAARASLLRIPGDDIDRVLREALRSADVKTRVELIRALAGRKASAAIGDLFKLARDADAAVRREAIAALGALAGQADLAAFLDLAAEPKEAGDRTAVEQALAAALPRIRDPQKRAAPILAALGPAPAEARPALVRLLGQAATPESLAALRAALKSGDSAVRDAAIRTLSEWPDPRPAEDLLALAQTAAAQSHKVLALRGYVRMAGMSPNPTAMYARALQLAQRTDDKKLVLAGLGSADSAEALALVERHLGDAALQAEAGSSAVQIADRIRQGDPRRARSALARVLAAVKDPRVRQQAQDVVNEIEQYEGYVLTWLVAGPYKVKGQESRGVFDAVLPPETAGAQGVAWKPLTAGVGSWDVSLDAALGSQDHVAAFVRTRVWSPAEQDARLELGSDDAVKAWLNGRQVHANYLHRGLQPRQDLVAVKLRSGWNELMLKVVNHSGGWNFCCRVRRPDGTALGDLKVEAK